MSQVPTTKAVAGVRSPGSLSKEQTLRERSASPTHARPHDGLAWPGRVVRRPASPSDRGVSPARVSGRGRVEGGNAVPACSPAYLNKKAGVERHAMNEKGRRVAHSYLSAGSTPAIASVAKSSSNTMRRTSPSSRNGGRKSNSDGCDCTDAVPNSFASGGTTFIGSQLDNNVHGENKDTNDTLLDTSSASGIHDVSRFVARGFSNTVLALPHADIDTREVELDRTICIPVLPPAIYVDGVAPSVANATNHVAGVSDEVQRDMVACAVGDASAEASQCVDQSVYERSTPSLGSVSGVITDGSVNGAVHGTAVGVDESVAEHSEESYYPCSSTGISGGDLRAAAQRVPYRASLSTATQAAATQSAVAAATALVAAQVVAHKHRQQRRRYGVGAGLERPSHIGSTPTPMRDEVVPSSEPPLHDSISNSVPYDVRHSFLLANDVTA